MSHGIIESDFHSARSGGLPESLLERRAASCETGDYCLLRGSEKRLHTGHESSGVSHAVQLVTIMFADAPGTECNPTCLAVHVPF